VEIGFPAASWSRREVPVLFVSTLQGAIDHVIESARRGAAVAWVRNTVNDALLAADRLRQSGIPAELFHARFALGDRQVREAEVMSRFGKTSTNADRRGHVLVATQVIEQSLDLDFDVLVTDLAPVDLLIQRAGRLWRHASVEERERPRGVLRELVVLAPPYESEPQGNWVTSLLPGTARVYDDAGVLWRTVRVLSAHPVIKTPDGLRPLIESVYGSDEVPDALATAAHVAFGKRHADAAAANYQALKVTDGYDGSARAWSDDLEASTRLADEQTVVRLARVRRDGRIEPWDESDGPLWRRWALSEIRLRSTRVPKNVTADAEFWVGIEQERAVWKTYERSIPVLPLVHVLNSHDWVGTLTRPDRPKPITVSYSRLTGMTFIR
jgi:CRISPR-associated endonuclease/helicase Cas3